MGATQRPNFVLYVSDDHGAEYAGCYGNPDVRTPHLDALAAQGLLFTRAFAASPTCTPSRASLFSGLYPARHGAMDNHSQCRPDLRTLPAHLGALGYRVLLAGKTHVGPPAAFPFEMVAATVAARPGGGRRYRAEAIDTAVVRAALAKLARGPEPFCLLVCDPGPHVVWERHRGFDPEALSLPPHLVDTAVTRRALADYYQDIGSVDGRLGQVWAAVEDLGLAERTAFAYTTDHGAEWPHAKWTVYDGGIRVPLVVVWNGTLAAGGVTEAMVSHVDVLPTLVELAGGDVPAGLDGVSWAGLWRGEAATGRAAVFAAHNRDKAMNVFPQRCLRTRTHKYVRNLQPERTFTSHFTEVQGIPDSHAAVWESWLERARTDAAAARLVAAIRHDTHPAEELYDLRTDPGERTNLAGEPGSQALLAGMRAALAEWMEAQGDPGGV